MDKPENGLRTGPTRLRLVLKHPASGAQGGAGNDLRSAGTAEASLPSPNDGRWPVCAGSSRRQQALDRTTCFLSDGLLAVKDVIHFTAVGICHSMAAAHLRWDAHVSRCGEAVHARALYRIAPITPASILTRLGQATPKGHPRCEHRPVESDKRQGPNK